MNRTNQASFLLVVIFVTILAILYLSQEKNGGKNQESNVAENKKEVGDVFRSPSKPMMHMESVRYVNGKLDNKWSESEKMSIMLKATENFKMEMLDYTIGGRNPIFTIVTRTMDFGKRFERCCRSVSGMKRNFEHVILKDEVGAGMIYAEAALAAHRRSYRGEYICHLDDDDFVHNRNFTLDMERLVRDHRPLMVVFKVWHEPRKEYLPNSQRPVEGSICTNCALIHHSLYDKMENWQGLLRAHAGDYMFLHNCLLDAGHHVVWTDKDYFTVQSKDQFQFSGEFFVKPLFQGGLGNQLFQLGAAIGYAKKYGKKFVIDEERGTSGSGRSLHKWLVQNLQYQDLVREPRHVKLNEARFAFDPLPYKPGNVDLWGYFQSVKYFSHCEAEVKEFIRSRIQVENLDSYLPDTYIPNASNDTFFLNPDFRVCVHVRRTDYKSSDLHKVLGRRYYVDAMKLFPDHLFCVFSDDMLEAQQLLVGLKNVVFIQGGSADVDMSLMIQFKKFIIANSTFSWWASYLSESEQVVAPNVWFNEPIDCKDLFRDEFIFVETG